MTKSKKCILCLMAVAFAVMVIMYLILGIICTVIICFLGLIFLLFNLYAKKKMAWNADHLFSDIGRNYDYLLIGEPWNFKDLKGETICFFSPNRTLLSSYELGRRLFSLLKEDTGTLVISCREKQLQSKEISILDIPYLHEMQQYKYKITYGKFKTYLPFLFAPVATLRYFLASEKECIEEISLTAYPAIMEFCKARQIKLLLIKTK